MDDETRQQLTAQALGDQVAATLRDDIDNIRRVVDVDPTTWTLRDALVIKRALCGLVGLLYEGRI